MSRKHSHVVFTNNLRFPLRLSTAVVVTLNSQIQLTFASINTGISVGSIDGILVGVPVGSMDGRLVGLVVGFVDSNIVGAIVGYILGLFVGLVLGLSDGALVGSTDGCCVGCVGCNIGCDELYVGIAVGGSVFFYFCTFITW